MIANRNKSLFATIVMAITLANAAPLQDTTTAAPGEARLIDAITEHHIKDSTLELGNHSMHITSPTSIKEPHHKQHHHHHHSPHHQAHVVPTGEDYGAEISEEIPSNGEELAEHVINLRDYIGTLTEDEFEGFLEHYMENGSKDDMFALELALDLDADDRDDEDDFDYSAPFDTEDEEGGIRFVPYSEVRGGDRHRHHPQRYHNHRFQHKFEQEVGCDEEEIELGLCEPSVEFEQHPHSRLRHGHGQHEIDEEWSEEIAHSQRHHAYPHHLRHGEVIREEIQNNAGHRHHHNDHRVMLKADGSPFSDNWTSGRHIQHFNDADLLGLPQVQQISHQPFGISIIEQATPLAKASINGHPAHPVKVAEIHLQEAPSLAPRAVDEVSNKPF